jgi:hypothetical protein
LPAQAPCCLGPPVADVAAIVLEPGKQPSSCRGQQGAHTQPPTRLSHPVTRASRVPPTSHTGHTGPVNIKQNRCVACRGQCCAMRATTVPSLCLLTATAPASYSLPMDILPYRLTSLGRLPTASCLPVPHLSWPVTPCSLSRSLIYFGPPLCDTSVRALRVHH